MAKGESFKGLADSELQKKLNEFRNERFNLRSQQVSGKLENTARLRLVRRNIARLLTELRKVKR